MLHHCLTSWKDDAFRIFVGCYPNDPATISAVMAVAERDSRISIVIGPEPGPTTKGDCLNAIWKAMQRSEEHTSELQSLMRISYAVFCMKTKTIQTFKTK